MVKKKKTKKRVYEISFFNKNDNLIDLIRVDEKTMRFAFKIVNDEGFDVFWSFLYLLLAYSDKIIKKGEWFNWEPVWIQR
jgi:hypothetical protein